MASGSGFLSSRKSLVCFYLHLREPLVAVRRGAVKHHGFYYIRNVRGKICREAEAEAEAEGKESPITQVMAPWSPITALDGAKWHRIVY